MKPEQSRAGATCQSRTDDLRFTKTLLTIAEASGSADCGPPAGFEGGVSVEDCWDCHGTGTDPHGNLCIFCDGFGSVDEKEENERLWDDPCDDDDDAATEATER